MSQAAQFEVMMALDSCIVIEVLKNPKFAKKITRLFWGRHSMVVLQDVVLKESERILRLPREVIIQRIKDVLRKKVFVFATTDEMKVLAAKIVKQYDICHNSDSIILAAAKTYSWILFSIDKNLLRTADFEGILAFNPNRGGC
jgi:hypothetical protein